MKNTRVILMTIVLLTLSSCSKGHEVNRFLTSFEQFVDQVSQESSSYTRNDWGKCVTTFNDFNKAFVKLNEYMSENQIRDANVIKGKFKAITVKYHINNVIINMDDFFQSVPGMINEIK